MVVSTVGDERRRAEHVADSFERGSGPLTERNRHTDRAQRPHEQLDVEVEGDELADFDTEIVALVPGLRQAVLLEGGHAIVLDSCRREHEIDQVVGEIAHASGNPPSRIELWLDGVLREFARLGVVAPRGVTDPTSTDVEDVPDEAP